jgi:hypothetical protein
MNPLPRAPRSARACGAALRRRRMISHAQQRAHPHQTCGAFAGCVTLNGGGSSRHGWLPFLGVGAGSFRVGRRSALLVSGASSPAGIFSGGTV